LKRYQTITLAIVIIVVLIFSSIELFLPYLNKDSEREQFKQSGFRFGVSFCGNTSSQAKLLIDKVKNYTNLLIVQSGPVSTNETAMNEIVKYAVDSGLDVIVYFGFFNPKYPWQVPWLDYAKQHWGNHFLGVYLNDEPGGQTIDNNWESIFMQLKIHNSSFYYQHEPQIDLALNRSLQINNNQAAYHFVNDVATGLGLSELETRQIHSYTSDYALYWFDYLGGYDTIFCEFGSNQSTTQAIDLNRGAARMQNKTWGIIITWTYDQPPFIENATAMYNDLMAGYLAGAKYEVIFDYPQIGDNPYGILTDTHFTAMEKFWGKIQTLKPNNPPDVAFVLPHNYGWAMRGPQDPIWGVWAPDNTSGQIWSQSRKLLSQYGTGLDMVYDDSQFPVQEKYQQIYFWNQTA
jgi:hypothetical protein